MRETWRQLMRNGPDQAILRHWLQSLNEMADRKPLSRSRQLGTRATGSPGSMSALSGIARAALSMRKEAPMRLDREKVRPSSFGEPPTRSPGKSKLGQKKL